MLSYEMEDRDSSQTRWITFFVLISLAAHALLVLVLLLVGRYVPTPKFSVTPQESPKVNLTLVAPPPVQPPQKRPFMPTSPQANVKPKDTMIESDNDTNLTSHSKTDRNKDSVMPDVVSQHTHTSELQNSPNVPSKQQPTPPSAPAPKQDTPKDQPKPPQPTPPQPKPQPQTQKTPPKEAPPTTQPPPPTPPKTTAPKPTPAPVDPNGLPVLPPIDAPTLAPQSAVTAQQAAQAAVPPPVLPAVASNVAGRAGLSGQPSPDAMKTELGRYKAKVYRAVGSRWYDKVGQQLQVLPVGIVRIQYTIHYDGTMTYKVIDGGDGTMQLLLSISINSLIEAAPFDPFTDAMRKQVGDDYTDDFSFSIYGGG